ncbi:MULTISPECIES: hypothetical protein [unclassified Actinoplanes]|uniref:hypothetical protein n=1 Tax=unclassified Actinoplanes TaxID=2626549 RepID=UPI00043A32B0|nr:MULTISPECIES: hypothetical protein [unclassified Actinoplanes]
MLLDATVRPAGGAAPLWTPDRLWSQGPSVFLHDQATDGVHEAHLAHGDEPVLRFGHWHSQEAWWALQLGRTRAAHLQRHLAGLPNGARTRVSAVAAWTENLSLVALNDYDEVDPPSLVLFIGDRISHVVTLDREYAAHVGDACFASPERIVVTDDYLHLVQCLDLSGRILWRRGERGKPGADIAALFTPIACCALDGTIVIANRRSSDLITLDLDGNVIQASIPGAHVRSASAMTALDDKHALISDAYAGSLHLLTANRDRWTLENVAHPEPTPATGEFSFPRAILSVDERLLIADTNNSRLLCFPGDPPLALPVPGWPRSAIVVDDAVLVADGLGSVLRKHPRHLSADTPGIPLEVRDRQGRPVALADPHHLAHHDANSFWLTDSSLNDVLLITLDGTVSWRWTESPLADLAPLSDPHQTLPLTGTDEILVVDSLNHRVLQAAPSTGAFRAVLGDDAEEAIEYPRFLLPIPDGWLLSSESPGCLSTFDSKWRHRAQLAVHPADSPRPVHMAEPPRALFATADFLYVPDFMRGVVYVARQTGQP